MRAAKPGSQTHTADNGLLNGRVIRAHYHYHYAPSTACSNPTRLGEHQKNARALTVDGYLNTIGLAYHPPQS